MSPTLPGPLNDGALAAAVRAGDATLGTFLGTASAITAEVCAASGFDWLLLDLEHGAGGEEQVRDVVPAAGSYGVPTVVRVETDERIRMGRVLDNGAAGIMLPRIDTADSARAGADASAIPAARGPRGRHLQPGLPVRLGHRRSRPGRRRDPGDRADRVRRRGKGGRRDRRGRRCRCAVHRPQGPVPRPRRPRRRDRPGVRRGVGHRAGRRQAARQGLRPARHRRRRGGQAARTGLDLRGHRVRLHPAGRRVPRSSCRPPAPDHQITLPEKRMSWLDTSTTRASPRSVSA